MDAKEILDMVREKMAAGGGMQVAFVFSDGSTAIVLSGSIQVEPLIPYKP